MSCMKGKFIVIEGLDGSGKTSVIEKLKSENLENTVFTREPGGTEYGEKLRDILLDKALHGKISLIAEIIGFCSVRANHCDLVIRPALNMGKNIICDRFDMSTIAYQIDGNYYQQVYHLFEQINSIAKGDGTYGIVQPDKVIYLDIDPAVGLARSKERGSDNGKFDSHRLDFYYRVRESYLSQYSKNKNLWEMVDAKKPLDVVYQEVKNIIFNLIKN